MKIANLTFPLILLMYACAGSGSGDSQQGLTEDKTEAVNQAVEDQASSLNSPMEETQAIVEEINKSIRAKRSHSTQTIWKVDSMKTIAIEEFSTQSPSQRIKLIYEANFLTNPHPLLMPEDSLIRMTKTYYYERNHIRFVDEVVDYTKDSLTKVRMENRFYIEKDRLIHWEKDGEDMDQSHAMYSYFQAILIDKYYLDLRYAYDLSTDMFPANEPIMARSRSSLIKTYREVLHWRYPENDTVEVIYEGNLMTNVALLEVIADSSSNDPSILMRLSLNEHAKDRYWEGEESLIGRAYQHRAQIKTPGDFYYTMMKIVEMEELDKLRSMIPAQGVYSHATAIVGDIDKPQYDEGITTMRDSIQINDVSAWFNSDVFRFDVYIDDTFDDEGWGIITWYGGGFMEEIKAQQSGGELYLMEHRSMDH